MYHHATRHINIQIHWIQFHVNKSFELKFCTSQDNLADFLTKSLPWTGIAANKLAVGVGDFENMRGCDDNKGNGGVKEVDDVFEVIGKEEDRGGQL